MFRLFLLSLTLFFIVVQPLSAAGWSAKVAPVGGVYGMFNRSPIVRGQEFEPVIVRLSLQANDKQEHTIIADCSASDIFDQPVIGWDKNITINLSKDNKPVSVDMLLTDMGFFRVSVALSEGNERLNIITDVGIIPYAHVGIRKDSFFASNTSGLHTGLNLRLLEAIGMKVQRAHFQPPVSTNDKEWALKPATGQAQPLDFIGLDNAFTEAKEHGVWVLPIVGYALQGSGGVAKTINAEKTGMHGPPRDFDEFVNTWEQIVRHYPEVTTYEFWNEPWIFGWTWCDTPASYRLLQTQWAKMALSVNPKLRIIAGNSSMFTTDHIEQYPISWENLIQGTSHHPYGWGTGQANWRDGDQFRSMDEGMQVTNRMKLPYYYLTEGGTQYTSPPPAELLTAQAQLAVINKQISAIPTEGASVEAASILKELTVKKNELASVLASMKLNIPNGYNNLENAGKIVIYLIRDALLGGFQGNAQWGIGYGPEWTKPNTAYAVLSSFLEDRPIVADIWPHHSLIFGAIFANPSQITPEVKTLPRAGELTSRWSVPIAPEYQNDITKVSVLWGLTGSSATMIDKQATITLNRLPDIRAYDISGREILPKGNNLTVSLNENPVFLTTDKLSVVDFRTRISEANIDIATPVNIYAQSLKLPADKAQTFTIRIENQFNKDITGKLLLKIGGVESGITPFTILSGRLSDIEVNWPGMELSPINQYAVTLIAETECVTADTPGGVPIKKKLPSVTKTQLLQSARFSKRTITVDGLLNDWQGEVPVLLDSRLLVNGFDPTIYLLNPGLEKPTGDTDEKRIMARIYTAYDTNYVYLAAAVQENSLNCTAGIPVEKGRGETKIILPYKNGMPDGLNHIVFAGDVLQFAFGFRDRVPGFGRQMNDPYAWKGMFYDTDDVFVAHISTEGDQLIRQWGEKTARSNAYQTEIVAGYESVPNARIRINRNEEAKLTIYEMAIPRAELKLFNPDNGKCRFGFRLYNNEQLGEGNSLGWSETASVFDYWRNSGSFTPTWTQHLPCQTEFGISN